MLADKPVKFRFHLRNGCLYAFWVSPSPAGASHGYVAAGGKVSQVTETLHLRPDEHLFGLGEKFTALDKSGQRIVSWTVDAFGSTTERSHKNIPFLWSTKGFGLLIDSGARISWEIGTVSSQSCAIAIDAPAFAAYVFRGRTPAELLATYCELT